MIAFHIYLWSWPRPQDNPGSATSPLFIDTMLNKNKPFFKKKTLKNFAANTVFSFIARKLVTLQQKKRQEISRNSMLNEIVVATEMFKSTKKY